MARLLSCGGSAAAAAFSDVLLLLLRAKNSCAVSFLAQKYIPNRPQHRAMVRASLVSEPRLLRRAPSTPVSCAMARVSGLLAAREDEETMTAVCLRGRVRARATRSRRRRDWESVVERAPVRRLV